MDKNEIFEKIKEIIVDRFAIEDPDTVEMSTSLVRDLEADSLYFVDVILAVEELFDIEIPDESAENFETIEDFVDFVASVL